MSSAFSIVIGVCRAKTELSDDSTQWYFPASARLEDMESGGSNSSKPLNECWASWWRSMKILYPKVVSRSNENPNFQFKVQQSASDNIQSRGSCRQRSSAD